MLKCPDVIATNREVSLLTADIERHRKELTEQLSGSRICVIGGAGSIGRATIEQLLDYPIGQIVVIDQDENSLASLMRHIQTRTQSSVVKDIITLPFDYGSAVSKLFFKDHGQFDHVLNFAALKHVRTEKNAYSALALINNNVLKPTRLMNWMADVSPKASYFSVSTDKAANPVSFMGASKRLMEHAMFGSSVAERLQGRKVSARFANVAYSRGSLLESFAQRLQARVPLAAPVGISRYFISQEEAGSLCLLASILGGDNQILFPHLNPEENLIPVEMIARNFLEANGYEADIFTLDETDDAIAALDGLSEQRKWPLVLTPADTAGEKPFEEFVGDGERTSLTPFHELLAVAYSSDLTSSEIETCLSGFEHMLSGNTQTPISLNDVKEQIGLCEPSFLKAHKASEQHLDNRI